MFFIFSPRFAPLWAVPLSGGHAKTGISDSMTPGDIANLSQSDELAFTVTFKGEKPKQNELYWRGLVMQNFDGKTWTQFDEKLSHSAIKKRLRINESALRNKLVKKGYGRAYEVIYEKTARPWLFALAPVVNIEGEAGVGYVVRRGFDLPPLMFSKEEISALTLGARIVESWADPALATAAQLALSKIETVLPDELKDSTGQTRLFAPMTQIRPDVASKMAQVRVAADNRNKLLLDYSDAKQQVTQRTIWPLGLFFWGAVWTIGSWCELRQAFRIFRLDRIRNISVLDDCFPNERGKTLEDLIEHERKSHG